MFCLYSLEYAEMSEPISMNDNGVINEFKLKITLQILDMKGKGVSITVEDNGRKTEICCKIKTTVFADNGFESLSPY